MKKYSVCLLDLNYTLIKNQRMDIEDFGERIPHQTFEPELLKKILTEFDQVILITHRHQHFKVATMQSIQRKLGWQPDIAIFRTGELPPHLFKAKIIREQYPTFINNPSVIGIESNKLTRKEYKKLGIKSMPKAEYMSNTAQGELF